MLLWRGMRRISALLFLILSTPPALSATADPVYKTLREAGVKDTFLVENVVIRRDVGVLTLKSGTLGLTAPQLGRDTVAVFSGDGEFVFTPTVGVEVSYLKSITGKQSVQERFDRAVFCFTDDTGKEIRANAKAGGEAKLDEILRDFRKRIRRRSDMARSLLEGELNSDTMDNVEADLLADLYNPAQAGFFSAYLHGRSHTDLRFHVRPRGALASLPAPEEVAVFNVDPGAVADGIWCLCHLKGELEKGTASSAENKRTVRADSYKIDTAIASNDHFHGSTGLSYTATGSDRVIKFALRPTLRVSRVSSSGKDVDFVQEDKKEDGTLYVILPERMTPASSEELQIEYEGDRVVRKEGGGNFSVGARESWYPNVNTFRDHASYDLTFRVPKRYTLVGVGRMERQWTEKDAACSHWVSEAPIAVAGFNYGEFKKKQITDPSINFTIEGYASGSVPDYLKTPGESDTMSPSRLDRECHDRGAERLAGLTPRGSARASSAASPLPSNRRSTTDNPGPRWSTCRSARSWTRPSAGSSCRRISNGLTAFIDEVTAHEVAHQWWGHMVGFESYPRPVVERGLRRFLRRPIPAGSPRKVPTTISSIGKTPASTSRRRTTSGAAPMTPAQSGWGCGWKASRTTTPIPAWFITRALTSCTCCAA